MEYKNRLPHFDHKGRTFFVTFRLHNSIEINTAKELISKRAQEIDDIPKSLAEDERVELKREINKRYFGTYEGLLDSATFGDRYLSDRACTDIVKSALHENDGKLYRLEAYCIMSNHVHMILDTSIQLSKGVDDDGEHLWQIMKRIKGMTARRLNAHLNTSGKVWARESFDTYIRNEKHYVKALNYTINNPVKAGLVDNFEDWYGTYMRAAEG